MNRIKRMCVGLLLFAGILSTYAVEKNKDITGFRSLQFGNDVNTVEGALAHPQINELHCGYPKAGWQSFGYKTSCKTVEDKVDISGITFVLTAKFNEQTNLLEVIELINFNASPELFSSMVHAIKAQYGNGMPVDTKKKIAQSSAECEISKTRLANGTSLGSLYYKRTAAYDVYVISRSSGIVVIEYKKLELCENLFSEWKDYKVGHPSNDDSDEFAWLTVTYLRSHRSTNFDPKDF